MDKNNAYYRRVQLLVRLLPVIAGEKCFALKGGTAINLFIRDLPRLSVDIDLAYLPAGDRDAAMADMRQALARIATAARETMPGLRIGAPSAGRDAMRLLASAGGAQIKIEVSPVLRGAVHPVAVRDVRETVEENFGYASMQVLSFADLYGGKICAALDRQHLRDLFDIKLLFENEGLSRDLIKTFLVYLISHNRPIAELLDPKCADISGVFAREFASMTVEPVTAEALEETRERLIRAIRAGLTEEDKQFLLSFKSRKPDWPLLGLEGIEVLPAVRWKLQNLGRMTGEKHRQALEKLQSVLHSI